MSKRKLPARILIGSEPYALVLFEVVSKFPNGSPRDVRRLPEQATIRVDTDPPREFITAYVASHMVNR